MTDDLLIGGVLLAIAVGLVFIGRPNKAGESPRFLRFEASLVLYTPVVMIFAAFGVATILGALLGASH